MVNLVLEPGSMAALITVCDACRNAAGLRAQRPSVRKTSTCEGFKRCFTDGVLHPMADPEPCKRLCMPVIEAMPLFRADDRDVMPETFCYNFPY